MNAVNLIKSLSATNDTSSCDFKVVTFYHNQTLKAFLADNFGPTKPFDFKLSAPFILEKQDYLAVYNGKVLATPDGKSRIEPDNQIVLADDSYVSLFKIN